MNTPATASLPEIAGLVAQRLDAVFASLEMLRESVEPLIRVDTVKLIDLDLIQDAVSVTIGAHDGLVTGAGLAVGPGTFAEVQSWMQAWHVRNQQLLLTRHSMNPSSVDFYDYTEAPWFQQPRDTGEAFLTGPYMDFGGTDTRIVTAAVPVSGHHNTLSVVAADLSLAALERMLLGAIGHSSGDLALVTNSSRVIATNSARLYMQGRTTPEPAMTEVEIATQRVKCGWRLEQQA